MDKFHPKENSNYNYYIENYNQQEEEDTPKEIIPLYEKDSDGPSTIKMLEQKAFGSRKLRKEIKKYIRPDEIEDDTLPIPTR